MSTLEERRERQRKQAERENKLLEKKQKKEKKLSGREQSRLEFHRLGCLWYDREYANDPDPDYSPYYPGWDIVLNWIEPDEWIIDLGCGVGKFASRALAQGKHYLAGVDYSEEAIRQAKITNPESSFYVADLYAENVLPKNDLSESKDVYILLEVLEHLEQDIKVLSNIPTGKHVIISVPSFDCASHVRVFPTADDAKKRYQGYLVYLHEASVVMNPESGSTIWLLDCNRT